MLRKILLIALCCYIINGCTKLDENLHGQLSDLSSAGGTPDINALLISVYHSAQQVFQTQDQYFALSEMTTDEMVGPTRGPDWDDNGVWRVLHAQKWDADNIHIRDTYNSLLGIDFAATDLLKYDSTSSLAAQARLLRAFADFLVLDGWDQVPYRDPGESTLLPSRVRGGMDEFNYILNEVRTALKNLPDGPPAGIANKDAARVLLMKLYLNKGVYENRAAPTFDAADMDSVIANADAVRKNGKYVLVKNYFDDFAPNNTSIGTENIWTQQNDAGVSGSFGATTRSRWHTVMHYSQNPGGWNGFTTLSDFYNKFEASDIRRGTDYPTPGADNPGHRVNVGFYVGQQYNWADDSKLFTRDKVTPLVFTPEVSLIETNPKTLELTGIRPNKFPIDYTNDGSGNVDNDYPYFRLPDVMLMKAEAILRGGTATGGQTPLSLINEIRTNRGATPFTSATLDNLLDERGRELYFEGWRRNDLIRFGKFLTPFGLKDYTSDPKYLLFAIPNQQLAVNPNLTPNPGY